MGTTSRGVRENVEYGEVSRLADRERKMVKKILKAVLAALLSPAARRYEAGLLLLVYEAVRTALGHP